MTRIDRRRLLKVSGAGAVAASIGGLAAILAAGRAPDYGQTTSLQWLKFVDFVPVSHQLLRGRSQRRARKRSASSSMSRRSRGMEIQARITSAIQSATGPDIIMAINNWPQLHGDSVADVSDVAEEIGKAGDGSYETAKTVANDGNKWIAAPFYDPWRASHKPQILVGGNRL